MSLDSFVEQKLFSFVKDTFVGDDWDFQHTLSAVKWMKEIVAHEGGNERVLVPVMYLHDVGYAGLLKNGYSLDNRIEAKSHHMERGVELAKQLLPFLGFSESEIKAITYLIGVHDKLDELRTKDELFVLEADSLAQIDPMVPQSTFGEDEYARYVEIFGRKRAPRFLTQTGKKALQKLVRDNNLFWKYTTLFK